MVGTSHAIELSVDFSAEVVVVVCHAVELVQVGVVEKSAGGCADRVDPRLRCQGAL